MRVTIFPSGGHPESCPDGHPWRAGTVLIGNHPCGCPAAREHFNRHVYVRCDPPGGKCDQVWYDPPCTPA